MNSAIATIAPTMKSNVMIASLDDVARAHEQGAESEKNEQGRDRGNVEHDEILVCGRQTLGPHSINFQRDSASTGHQSEIKPA